MSLEQVVNLSRIVSKLYIDATKANQKNSFILTGFTVVDVRQWDILIICFQLIG